MKKEKRVLSLDTSSTVSGWALFVNNKYKNSGVIDCRKEKDTSKRTKKMCLGLSNLITEYCPTHIVIEQLPSTRNAQTTRLLSKIIGTVYYQAIAKNIPYLELSCSAWRSKLLINTKDRNLAKVRSIARVFEKYNIKVDDNEADAINIGEAFHIIEGKETT